MSEESTPQTCPLPHPHAPRWFNPAESSSFHCDGRARITKLNDVGDLVEQTDAVTEPTPHWIKEAFSPTPEPPAESALIKSLRNRGALRDSDLGTSITIDNIAQSAVGKALDALREAGFTVEINVSYPDKDANAKQS